VLLLLLLLRPREDGLSGDDRDGLERVDGDNLRFRCPTQRPRRDCSSTSCFAVFNLCRSAVRVKLDAVRWIPIPVITRTQAAVPPTTYVAAVREELYAKVLTVWTASAARKNESDAHVIEREQPRFRDAVLRKVSSARGSSSEILLI
jgi:hypothetical protein